VKGGKELKMDLLVMENLLFGRNITRLYDLKGSSRSRYNADSSGSNKVLLDQNLLEAMPTSPIFVGNKAKRLLERAVWNDTSFLAVSLPLPWTVVDIINRYIKRKRVITTCTERGTSLAWK
jgi:1-phosphatidylinositol-3-phosphate 5-kinase